MTDAKDVIRQVRKIDIATKRLVTGLMAGSYHSVFKGSGIEFSDIREYVAGDDVRSIDWNVTARMDTPYIKEFIEERDLRVYVIIDLSGSASFGNIIAKQERSINLAASLMFSALKNNDAVGLVLITDTIERFVSARKGKLHLQKLLAIMVAYIPLSKRTDLNVALRAFSHLVKRQSLLFIISDFYEAGSFDALKLLRNRHDIVAMQVDDPSECSIPDVGLIELEDPESGEQLLVDTSSLTFRQSYENIIANQQSQFETQLRKLAVDLVKIPTNASYVPAMRAFFKARMRRR